MSKWGVVLLLSLVSLHKRLAQADQDKAFKICSVSGGLDVTRLVSSTTRSFFRSAIEDVELIREVISESAYYGGLANGLNMGELSQTLDWQARNLTAQDTTVTAGLGYSDDRRDRHIERYVSLSENAPFVGTKESDLAMVEAASTIFPWLVDRRSLPSSWFLEHPNGRNLPSEGKSSAVEQLYTAAWIGTKGEAWLYYPPLTVYGHPLNFGDVLGSHYESQEEEFVKPNLPENNPERISYFTKPYPDTAVPGLSLITALAPVYFTGTFQGYEYQETYVASTGVDIAVSAVSSYLDVVQDSLTPHSFGCLVDADFATIVISQFVTQQLYPETTGNEDSRVAYDPDGNIVHDRRNQPYLPSDTILQPLTDLTNADWQGLLGLIRKTERGQRDIVRMNVTLTGDQSPTAFHIMFDRWETVADWILLVFVPVEELEGSIDVFPTFANANTTKNYKRHTISTQSNVTLEGAIGDVLQGSYFLINNGNLDVLIRLKHVPEWLSLKRHDFFRDEDFLLAAGQNIPVEFDVTTGGLAVGTQSAAVTFQVQDAHYPDCLYGDTLTVQVAVKLTAGDCDVASETIDSQGNCVCLADRVRLFSKCLTVAALVGFLMIPLFIVIALITLAMVWRRDRREKSLWQIDEKEVVYDDPPRQIGRGGFGVVLLADFRGTPVAVKKLHGSETVTKGNNLSDSILSSDAAMNIEGGNTKAAVHHSFAKPTHNTVGNIKETKAIAVEYAEPAASDVSPSSWTYSTGTAGTKGHTRRGSQSNQKKFVLKDFAADMRVLASLRHPCITTIFGAVIPKKSEPLLLMEYVEHKSLFELLQKSTVELDGDTLIVILRDISQGIQYLHNTKVVHGDIKSSNTLIDGTFRAKLADFGISYKVGILGTTLWMAPELLRKESDPTTASDVFSFGILLYEIYARKAPYEGDDIRVIVREICDPVIHRRPVVPPNMPNRVTALMQDCLSANPSERPTMDEIVSRIKRFSSRDVAPMKAFHQKSKTLEEESKIFQGLLKRFPRKIAEDLRDGREIAPENHECVTVFVGHIVGFESLALELSQKKMFDMISRLHCAMDKLAHEQQVFKIETTGEQWMGVTNCGQSDQSGTHAKIMASFALAVVQVASRIWIDPEQPELGVVQVRVSFHSGPVLTHVVGVQNNNPRFALFGESVNTAMRIAQDKNNKPGLVHCSQASALLLSAQASDAFESSPSDKGNTFWVNVKGKRASAAYDRIRQKQEMRIIKEKKRVARKQAMEEGLLPDDALIVGMSSCDTASLGSIHEDLLLSSSDGNNKNKDKDNEENGSHDKMHIDISKVGDELAMELAQENQDSRVPGDDDGMTDLQGSLKNRLVRNHKQSEF